MKHFPQNDTGLWCKIEQSSCVAKLHKQAEPALDENGLCVRSINFGFYGNAVEMEGTEKMIGM